MFAQQAGAAYLDAGQAAQNFTAATTPGAVTSGQTFLQVTPAGTAMQAQRHPITHTTRASPATVSYPFLMFWPVLILFFSGWCLHRWF